VLGADTSVVYEEHILGKPRSRDDARRMLSMLSGKTHRVLTGICVCSRARGVVVCDCAVTHVTFRPLSAEVVDRYLDTHTYADKAGAYGIQDIGDVFAAAIDGSFENVVGLPLEETARLLETARSKEGLA
jgi:septum formation protein